MHAGIKMAAPMKKFLLRIIPQTRTEKPLGSVIFLHGSGDTGLGVQAWVNSLVKSGEFSSPHLRVLFPTAPARPYTPSFGQYSNVWYDRMEISPNASDDVSIDEQASALKDLIKAEVDLGIPENKIIIGGFSMGGGMALHLGYRFHHSLAGVFALSSFLSSQSKVYDTLRSKPEKLPPLFQAHGESDGLVLYPWGQATHTQLTNLGVNGPFYSIPGLDHEMDPQTISNLITWINRLIPDTDSTNKL